MASDDPGVPDGLKVDVQGNVFCTGPGGVWVCRADGTLLGRIVLPELPANLAGARTAACSSSPRAPASTGCRRRRAARCWADPQPLAPAAARSISSLAPAWIHGKKLVITARTPSFV